MAQNKEKWDNRLVCDICNQCFTRPKKIIRGTQYPKIEKLCKLDDHRNRCKKYKGESNCGWCGMRGCLHYECPLRKSTCKYETWKSLSSKSRIEREFGTCFFKGNYAQVEWHRSTCKIKCQRCNQNLSSRGVMHHMHIIKHWSF